MTNEEKYIEALEVANKRFEEIGQLKQIIEELELEIKCINKRIDKAIEYIEKMTKKELNYITYKGKEYLVCGSDFSEGSEIILDILKGSDNND